MSLQPYSRKAGSQPESPAVAVVDGGLLEISGYQRFRLGRTDFDRLGAMHRIKFEIIRPYLQRLPPQDRVADIGCSAGAIGLQVGLLLERKLSFIDHDPEYIDVVQACLRHLGMTEHETHACALTAVKASCPVGIAFALIHWIYSFSEKLGSLDRAVGLLKTIATRDLFVEWVAPDDPVIRSWRHIEQNPESIREAYELPSFLKALQTHYGSCRLVGEVSPTRSIWYASSAPVELGVLEGALSSLRVWMRRGDLLGERLRKRLGHPPD